MAIYYFSLVSCRSRYKAHQNYIIPKHTTTLPVSKCKHCFQFNIVFCRHFVWSSLYEPCCELIQNIVGSHAPVQRCRVQYKSHLGEAPDKKWMTIPHTSVGKINLFLNLRPWFGEYISCYTYSTKWIQLYTNWMKIEYRSERIALSVLMYAQRLFNNFDNFYCSMFSKRKFSWTEAY